MKNWRLHEIAIMVGAGIALVLLWHIAAIRLNIEILLPTPGQVLYALWSLLSGPLWGPASIYYHFLLTSWEAVAGFIVGSALGVLIGIVTVQFRVIDVILTPYLVAFQSIPRMAVAPLLIIWFGQNLTSRIIIGASITFLPALVGTVVGLRSVDPDLLDMLRGFSASRWQVLRKVKFIAALPLIMAGLHTGIVFAVVAAIVAEWVGADSGLGTMLLTTQYNMNVPSSFAILIIMGVMGTLLTSGFSIIERRVDFWVLRRKVGEAEARL
jgi:NitT/TauT family transport system permease protein